MDGSTVSPTVALVVAVGGALAATVVPIVIAWINRGGTERSVEIPSNVAVKRSEWDGLLEHVERMDAENDRLNRELERKETERAHEHDARIIAEERLQQRGLEHP